MGLSDPKIVAEQNDDYDEEEILKSVSNAWVHQNSVDRRQSGANFFQSSEVKIPMPLAEEDSEDVPVDANRFLDRNDEVSKSSLLNEIKNDYRMRFSQSRRESRICSFPTIEELEAEMGVQRSDSKQRRAFARFIDGLRKGKQKLVSRFTSKSKEDVRRGENSPTIRDATPC